MVDGSIFSYSVCVPINLITTNPSSYNTSAIKRYLLCCISNRARLPLSILALGKEANTSCLFPQTASFTLLCQAARLLLVDA